MEINLYSRSYIDFPGLTRYFENVFSEVASFCGIRNTSFSIQIVSPLKSLLQNIWPKNGLTYSDALRDLVPFVQFKKREKYPWRSVTFSKHEG